jgi:methylated-DNA-[protein]-cysteine S-methyltransferase
MKPPIFQIFSTQLGWMAVVIEGNRVRQLTFGHPTAAAAKAALQAELLGDAVQEKKRTPLIRRLRAYANGTRDALRDIAVDFGAVSEFRRRVLNTCRRISYGTIITYAELAKKSGYPGAARAVGSCMAKNRVPLLMPCHRVVCSNGRIGAYSSPGGGEMKRRLLLLENVKLT